MGGGKERSLYVGFCSQPLASAIDSPITARQSRDAVQRQLHLDSFLRTSYSNRRTKQQSATPLLTFIQVNRQSQWTNMHVQHVEGSAAELMK